MAEQMLQLLHCRLSMGRCGTGERQAKKRWSVSVGRPFQYISRSSKRYPRIVYVPCIGNILGYISNGLGMQCNISWLSATLTAYSESLTLRHVVPVSQYSNMIEWKMTSPFPPPLVCPLLPYSELLSSPILPTSYRFLSSPLLFPSLSPSKSDTLCEFFIVVGELYRWFDKENKHVELGSVTRRKGHI